MTIVLFDSYFIGGHRQKQAFTNCINGIKAREKFPWGTVALYIKNSILRRRTNFGGQLATIAMTA